MVKLMFSGVIFWNRRKVEEATKDFQTALFGDKPFTIWKRIVIVLILMIWTVVSLIIKAVCLPLLIVLAVASYIWDIIAYATNPFFLKDEDE